METLGPFKAIDSFLVNDNGPIQGYQQLVKMATLGPFKLIGSFNHGANSRLLATFLNGNIGPIQGYQQLHSWVMMGQFKLIGISSHLHQWADSSGPNQGYQQLFSAATLGPFKPINSFAQEQQWAHSFISAEFLSMGTFPIQTFWQSYFWADINLLHHYVDKKTTLVKTLCQGLPLPFIAFTQHIQSLVFNEKPQYDYLHALLTQCLASDSNNIMSDLVTILYHLHAAKLLSPPPCPVVNRCVLSFHSLAMASSGSWSPATLSGLSQYWLEYQPWQIIWCQPTLAEYQS
ncbi:hypothetical protein V8E53_004574 [Lactarius tabidus]